MASQIRHGQRCYHSRSRKVVCEKSSALLFPFSNELGVRTFSFRGFPLQNQYHLLIACYKLLGKTLSPCALSQCWLPSWLSPLALPQVNPIRRLVKLVELGSRAMRSRDMRNYYMYPPAGGKAIELLLVLSVNVVVLSSTLVSPWRQVDY